MALSPWARLWALVWVQLPPEVAISPEWLSSPLLYCLLLSSDPPGDRSASPPASPRCLTPGFPPGGRSLPSPAPPWALERGLLFAFFVSPLVTSGVRQ